MRKHALKIDFMKAAQIPDAEAICDRAFANSTPEDRQAGHDSINGRYPHPYVFFMATLNDKPAGIVGVFNMSADGDAYFNISTLAVDPPFQRRGIGRALMKHAEKFIRAAWMKKAGYAYLVDDTKRTDPSSRFYERMGYKPNHDDLDDVGNPVLYKWLKPLSRA